MFGWRLKARAGAVVGRVAAIAFPTLAEEVRRGNNYGKHKWLKKFISRSEIARLQSIGNQAAVQQALVGRWKSENLSLHYYDKFSDRFEILYNGPHSRIVDWLGKFSSDSDISQVIEVGCGDGRALANMAKAVPNISTWVGVDINSDVIERNKLAYADFPSLTFVAADAIDWLEDHAGPGSLLMTYGGVMEYIAPETLVRWFDVLSRRRGAGILLVEPVDPKHDLDVERDSHVWGNEQSYSHNHRALLEGSGFSIVQSAEVEASGYRWIMVLAALDVDLS